MKCCFAHCKKDSNQRFVKFMDQIYELYAVGTTVNSSRLEYWLCSIDSYQMNEDGDGYFVYFCGENCLNDFSNMFPCCTKCQGPCDCYDAEDDTDY